MNDALFLLLWFGVRCLTPEDEHACLRQIPAFEVTAAGYVTPYAPGVMEDVFRRRVRWQHVEPRWGHVPGCKCALNTYHVGRYAVIFYERGWRLCIVADVAKPEHAIERERLGLAVEVDSETYAAIGYQRVVVSVLE